MGFDLGFSGFFDPGFSVFLFRFSDWSESFHYGELLRVGVPNKEKPL